MVTVAAAVPISSSDVLCTSQNVRHIDGKHFTVLVAQSIMPNLEENLQIELANENGNFSGESWSPVILKKGTVLRYARRRQTSWCHVMCRIDSVL
uniref:Uncharacterized protein n=1 Tax=Physcomitrium patens TaxID=3218 RepID=A0A2K1KQ08_PHYPA|nr:hypothetical protein PHYPA_006771 [Physcomitrium patens]